jgi:hypothetical protein
MRRRGRTKHRKHEIILPPELRQPLWTCLGENNIDEPISDSRGKRISLSSDLHGHHLAHISPTHRAKGDREKDRHQEQHGHAGPREVLVLTVNVLGIYCGFDEETTGDGAGAKDQRLAAAETVGNKEDEEEIGDGTNDVVDTRDEKGGLALEAEGLVHDRLIVVDNVFYLSLVTSERLGGRGGAY